MEKYEFTKELVEKISSYLARRPYLEVFQIIRMLEIELRENAKQEEEEV